MIFTNKIKQRRKKCQMLQQQLAASLNIDLTTYCKIGNIAKGLIVIIK